MKTESIDEQSPLLPRVKELGKINSSTLGFFPDGAFEDYARKGQILVAIDDDGHCAGYLLYRISNRIARVVHLCVAESSRGCGIAKLLVDHLKSVTQDLSGISLNCRHDYEANKIWPRFGFVAQGESRGRGKAPTTLIYWWFDHGHPTLFDLTNDTSQIVIGIDANIFFDFYDTKRPGYQESNSLRADWLAQIFELRPTQEILNEINRSDEERTRKDSREHAGKFTLLSADAAEIDRVAKELRGLLPKDDQKLNIRDKSDIRQIAIAVASDVPYFVTRDQLLLKQDFVNSVKDRFALTIIRPADLIRQLDEIRSEADYQPVSLSGTEIKQVYVKSGQETDLTRLFCQREPHNAFRTRFRGCLADVQNTKCFIVADPTGSPIAVLGIASNDRERLYVPILRVRPGRIALTLAKHLVADLVHKSVQADKTAIEITDPFPDAITRSAILENGFIKNNASFVKFHLPIVRSRRDIVEKLAELSSFTTGEATQIDVIRQALERPLLDLSPQIYADVENLLFPLKITDAPIPTFMIPIQPQWASELFDSGLASQGLFPAQYDLALRKEQVYYRSARNSAGIGAPARILWYVSKGNSRLTDVGAIRASSLLTHVVVDRPKQLYDRYRRLGIYQWSDLLGLARGELGNNIMALVFGGTERFVYPVSLDNLRQISVSHRFGLQLQSVSRIPSSAFAEIYGLGMNRTHE